MSFVHNLLKSSPPYNEAFSLGAWHLRTISFQFLLAVRTSEMWIISESRLDGKEKKVDVCVLANQGKNHSEALFLTPYPSVLGSDKHQPSF